MSDDYPLYFKSVEKGLVGGNFGDSVRARAPGNPRPPTRHELIYILDQGSYFDIRRMRNTVVNGIDRSEAELFQKALDNDPTDPACIGRTFEHMFWNYPTYLTFVFDNDDLPFAWDYSAEYPDPIIFASTDANGKPVHENYAFYHAVPVVLTKQIGGAMVQRPGIRFQNLFTSDAAGTPIRRNERRKYKFDMLVLKSGVLNRIDPDGQNQGPPSP